MEVYNVPEASDTNTFAEKGKSEAFTEYQGISCMGGRKWDRNVKCRVVENFCEIQFVARYTCITKKPTARYGYKRMN